MSEMICLFCGRDVSGVRQKTIPIILLKLNPFIGQEEPGADSIRGAECCQECYEKILVNRGKAIRSLGHKAGDENV